MICPSRPPCWSWVALLVLVTAAGAAPALAAPDEPPSTDPSDADDDEPLPEVPTEPTPVVEPADEATTEEPADEATAQEPADEAAAEQPAPAAAPVVPAPRVQPAPAGEPPPADDDNSEGDTVLLGSTLGCAVGAVPPLAGTALGIGIGLCAFQQGTMASDPVGGCVIALLGAALGVLIGVPSAIAYGPCSSLGALIGGTGDAMLSGRAVWSALLGALPGVALGLVGATGTLIGLSTATDNGEPIPFLGGQPINAGWTIVLGSLALSLIAGPIAILGAVWLDVLNQPVPETTTAARAHELAAARVARRGAKRDGDVRPAMAF